MQDMPTNPFGLPFISFVVIILTFFIFLNTQTPIDPQRQHLMLSGLEKVFLKTKYPLLSRIKEKKLRPIDTPDIDALKERAAAAGYAVQATGARVVLSTGSDSLFAAGNDEVSAGSLNMLQQIAACARLGGLIVRIVVHSGDEGDAEPGFALALSRAQAVYRLFIDSGVPAENLTASAAPSTPLFASRAIVVLDREPRPFIPDQEVR